MAITIDYSDDVTPEFIINIPKADTTLVTPTPTEVRSLDIADLWNALLDIQDDDAGIWALTAFNNTAPSTLGGVTFGRVLEIFAPYKILFENGLYNVNIIGGNSNIIDVTIKNSVGLSSANSAGLILVDSVDTDSLIGHIWASS